MQQFFPKYLFCLPIKKAGTLSALYGWQTNYSTSAQAGLVNKRGRKA
jgi:hypothetical protein